MEQHSLEKKNMDISFEKRFGCFFSIFFDVDSLMLWIGSTARDIETTDRNV
jgi:hypothetical protein